MGKSVPRASSLADQDGHQDNIDNIPEIEKHTVNDDHHYTQSSEEVSAAITKQLSSEHSYISNPVISPTVHGISLLQPASSVDQHSNNKNNVPKRNALTDTTKNGKKVNDKQDAGKQE